MSKDRVSEHLIVSVLKLIDAAYREAGMKVPTVNELLRMCPPDDACWDVYKRGATMGINQVEKAGTRSMCEQYAPTNISELSAFVAAVRPGFASMRKQYLEREHFSLNFKPIDDLIQTKEMPESYIFYQEQVMAILNYAGFPMSECYTAIKNIAKKRAEKVFALKESFASGLKAKAVQDGMSEDKVDSLVEHLWQVVYDNANYSFNCISGDTRIIKGASGRHAFNPTISEMYNIMHSSEYAKRTGHKDLHGKYVFKGYGTALSMFDDNRIHNNHIKNIWPVGEAQTYKITTSSGANISCTDNHKFPTPFGLKELKDIHVGDYLYVKGEYEKDKTSYRLTTPDTYTSNLPIKGERGFQENPNGDSVLYNLYRDKAKTERRCCEQCGKPYSETERFEVHHIDFDRHHNELSNYVWVCASCHKQLHYANGRKHRYDKGIPTFLDEVISIVPDKIEMVYNIEMEDPAHTFVTDSGLVVANCSHSYCVALDSLYGAWIKAHHPLAFYKAYLEVMDDKGDKDKMMAAKAEAEAYYNIHFPAIKFGQNNIEIKADPKTNNIYNALSSVKGYSKTFSKLCWACAQERYTSFIDVLEWFDKHSVKTAKLKPLINIDYFSRYGNIPTLSRICDMWDMMAQGQAKQLKRDTLSDDFINRYGKYLTLLNAKGEALKAIKVLDSKAICYEYERFIIEQHISDIPYKLKMQNQIDILGYCDLTTGKEEDRQKLLILDCQGCGSKYKKENWGYRLGTKSIGSGKVSRVTIMAEIYKQLPIDKGDIIYVEQLHKNKKGYWCIDKYRLEE